MTKIGLDGWRPHLNFNMNFSLYIFIDKGAFVQDTTMSAHVSHYKEISGGFCISPFTFVLV